jgi:GNAT superfamily N-acetyltransferase
VRDLLEISYQSRGDAMAVTIRAVRPADEHRWRMLWDGYTRFYEREPNDELTRHTWRRILDRTSPVHSVVAETDDVGVIGLANYVIHDSTSTLTPVCYLQDLYVDPAVRAGGVGEQLMDWLRGEAARQGWSRLYWNTRENNYRARALYDKYTPHSGFLRYVLLPKPRD